MQVLTLGIFAMLMFGCSSSRVVATSVKDSLNGKEAIEAKLSAAPNLDKRLSILTEAGFSCSLCAVGSRAELASAADLLLSEPVEHNSAFDKKVTAHSCTRDQKGVSTTFLLINDPSGSCRVHDFVQFRIDCP